MTGKARAYLRFLAGLREFLAHRVSPEDARREIARRLEAREGLFLRFVRRCVFDNPRSPYPALFAEAGCAYGDVEAGVRRWGLDGFLIRLKEAGVRIAFDEFKGRQPLVRGGLERLLSPGDFDNPHVSAAMPTTTGGSTGQAVRAFFDIEHLTARTIYDAAFFDMLGLGDVPLAVWYPQLPACTGLSNSLRYARLGHAPVRWFDMLGDGARRPSVASRLVTAAAVLVSRTTPRPIAWPEPIGLGRVDRIVDWIAGRQANGGRCAVQSYVSQAVRISRAARRRGLALSGTQFIVGSEPLTPAKADEIHSTGAAVYPRYMGTEVGTIGLGCGTPTAVDDHHLACDTVTLVQDEGAADGGILYLTTLLDTTPKVLINVSLGDRATVVRRGRGCPFGEVGLDTHLSDIRSLARVTCEGMAVPASDLVQIAEEVLRPKYGGSALDYQWVEREDAQSLSRLVLRVAPSVGPVDTGAMVRDVLVSLERGGRGSRMVAGVWARAGAIEVVRLPPTPTERGKFLPLLKERAARV
jgi:hypothetical protein